MTAKKTTRPSKGRRPAARKSKKKKSFPFGRLLVGSLFLLFLALAGYIFLLRGSGPQGIEIATLESLLVTADVDLKRNRQIAERDDFDRWKIDVTSVKKLEGITRGLESLLVGKGLTFLSKDQSKRDRTLFHSLDVPLANGERLRLILVYEPLRKKPRNSKKPPKKSQQVVRNSSSEKISPVRTVDPDGPRLNNEEFPMGTDALQEGRPMIAVVLDDIGHHKVSRLNPVLELKLPITFAVLPHLSYSGTNAIHLYQHQYEIMLHMPMEPDNYPKNNPGKGAILSSFSDADIKLAIERAVKSVPFAIGINNHMGSKITTNRTLMRSILRDVKTRNLYYLDSRTSGHSVAFSLAKEMGLRTARRHVFLDSEESFDFAMKQLEVARKTADRTGVAIIIGHPYPSSLRALAQVMPKFDRQGYRFVFASALVHDYDDQL